MMNNMKLLIIAVMIISAALLPALVVGSRPVKCDNCMDGGEKEEIMKMSSGVDVSHRILQAKRFIDYEHILLICLLFCCTPQNPGPESRIY